MAWVMSKHDILNQIINDLNIRNYEGEGRNQYISRVVYSALSMWIRVSTLDGDIFQQPLDKIGVSKIHILNRCQPFLDNMIELYPEIHRWFYPKEDKKNPIVIIRDRLCNGGDLVDVGFNTDLALPSYQECVVNNRVGIIRGYNVGYIQKVAGLAQLKVLDEENTVDIEKALEFYDLKDQTAEEILWNYIKNIKWNKREGISDLVFNKYCENTFSNSWDSEYKLKVNDISLYKYGINDFGFVKKTNGSIYTSQINQYLIERFEVRRFMYGLKCEVKNSIVAKYKKYEEAGLVELNLYNGLPGREQNILLLLGWPLQNVSDKYNLLFDASVWLFVKKVLKNLNVTLQEAG
jgi:hypothetical protein